MTDDRPIPPSMVLVTDWRLDIVQGKTFGICMVLAPEGYRHYGFKRGFPLSDPTHIRCAIFAAVLGMEQIVNSPDVLARRVFGVVVTKSPIVARILVGEGAAAIRRWVGDARRSPTRMYGYGRQFLGAMCSLMDDIRAMGVGDLVYTPDASDGRRRGGLLSEHTVHLDIDPELDYDGKDAAGRAAAARDGDGEDIITGDAKQRNALRQELLLSGARASRGVGVLTRAQRREIAETEGHGGRRRRKKKKEVPGDKRPTTERCPPINVDDRTRAVGGTGGGDGEGGGGGPRTPAGDSAPTPAPARSDGVNPHGGLAAAIAAEERRVAIAAADAAPPPAGGAGDPEPADAAGHVQEQESGAD